MRQLRRIQWSNSGRPTITFYGADGFMGRLEHPKAVEVFNAVVMHALKSADEAIETNHEQPEGSPV